MLAERLDKLLRVDWTDAFDHAGAEVFFEPLERGRDNRRDPLCLELETVITVVQPSADDLDILAGTDRRGMPGHRYQITIATHLHAKHAKAILDTVKRDAFDSTPNLLVRCRSARRHGIVGNSRFHALGIEKRARTFHRSRL